jgi:hypothetical protein
MGLVGAGRELMIPTRHKAKLPKTLSYPLGAQAISEALADAPHAGDFALWFSDTPVWPASEFQRRLREGLPYRVLTAEYMPARSPGYGGAHSLADRGWFDASWSLGVYPVPRELRHGVGLLLREQGLPAVAEWLRSSGRTGWDSRNHRIDFLFSPAEGSLSVQRADGV